MHVVVSYKHFIFHKKVIRSLDKGVTYRSRSAAFYSRFYGLCVILGDPCTLLVTDYGETFQLSVPICDHKTSSNTMAFESLVALEGNGKGEKEKKRKKHVDKFYVILVVSYPFSNPVFCICICFDGLVIIAQCTATFSDLSCSPEFRYY